MELKDKIVLVTGASSGIGQAVAIRFAKEGADVIIHFRKNEEGAKETQKLVGEFGVRSSVVKADLSVEKDVQDMFKQISAEYETLDILINNAASPTEFVPYPSSTQKDLLDLFNVNIVNAMLCSKYAMEIMKAQKSGKILNTTSIKGWEHGGSSVGYAVSKAAMNSFTRTLAKSVAPDIQVNAVAPGYVKTRVYDNQPEEKIKNWLNGTLLKRWVTLEEVAEAFIFLAKNDAMTGQILYIDGGFTLK
ncbi:SDR family oxidoreductase [bacterium]|nr:SDR family oxidoreductase [bacterium]